MRNPLSGYRVAVIVMLAANACADSAPSTPAPTDGVATIGRGGGRVTLSTGATVDVPEGALTSDVRITVRAVGEATALPAEVTSAGVVVSFGPDGQRFATAVTITLPTTSTANAVYTRSTSADAWALVEGARFDATQRVITVQTTHFSEYVPAMMAARPDAGPPPDVVRPDAGPPPDVMVPPDVIPPDAGAPPDVPGPCAAPRIRCGAACVDLNTDTANCGTCGAACPPGASCTGGVCRTPCASPRILCGTACVDLNTDTAHCGVCGRACPAGATCVSGVCQTACTSPRTMCGAACVDLNTDVMHCGMCGAACPAGRRCVGGACVP